MKIIENNAKSNFPIRVICEQIRDKYGYTYGAKNDFCGSVLEIEASDIKSILGQYLMIPVLITG